MSDDYRVRNDFETLVIDVCLDVSELFTHNLSYIFFDSHITHTQTHIKEKKEFFFILNEEKEERDCASREREREKEN